MAEHDPAWPTSSPTAWRAEQEFKARRQVAIEGYLATKQQEVILSSSFLCDARL